MNKFRNNKEEEKAGEPVSPKKAKKGAVGSYFASVLTGSFLTRENTLKQLPFIFFLTVMAMIYIANTYYAEKTLRDISRLTMELKELQSEYITAKSELTSISKQSEVARAAEIIGIKESIVPPKKIVFDKNSIAKN